MGLELRDSYAMLENKSKRQVQTAAEHHVEQVNKEVGVAADCLVSFAALLLEALPVLALLALTVGKCMHKVWRKNKLDALSTDTKLGLPVAKEMTKINVKELMKHQQTIDITGSVIHT